MMVDTGAAVTMVTKRWAELHGLKVSNDKRVTIRGAGGQNVEVIGTTAFTVQLAPTLEMDVADVVVSEGELYQALLGGDLLKGKPGILGPATITMPGLNH
jgi:predicted aspartyl protease